MRRRLGTVAAVTTAQLLAVFAIDLTARAQTANPPPTAAEPNPPPNPGPLDNGSQLEKMTVTGYLIPRVGDGPQPVTSYDRDYIQKTGYQTVTNVLQTLPSAVGNFGPNTTAGFSFSPGSASIGLKGLPPNDTLVLVDGLRYPQYPFPQINTAGITSFVDLNSISIAAVDRIEILNDGGSATYGTDAVAGVVNILLKNEYNGGDIVNYFGISQRGDEETYHGSFVGGISQKFSDTSKLSVVAAFDYYSQGPIMLVDRQNSSLEFSRLSSKYPDQPIFPNYAGQFTDPSGNFYQVKPGTIPPITASDFLINAAPNFEFNQKYVQLLPREDRLGGLIKLTYQVTDWLKLYDWLTIQRNEELSSFGPNQGVFPPLPNNSGGVTVPANNPFNPFGVPLTIQGLALGEFGPFRSGTTVTTIRNVVGATIQLPRDWLIDANFLYGESDGIQTANNNFTVNGLQAALNGTLPGHVGQFFNPFADESVVGPNRAFYGDKQLVASIWEEARTDIVQYHMTTGGTLVELPAGPLAVAGGFEYRSELFIQGQDQNSKFANITDPQYSLGKLTNGRRYIWSIFGEADIPIIGNQWSWPGLRDIDVAISERQDYYSDFGSAAKPKIAVRYKPFADLTLRATYSEGFVAPSLPELFGAPIIGTVSVQDPKNPQPGGTSVLSQVNGNPNLKPANAYTYYIGGVWSPGSIDPEHSWWGWANGFSAYINWFQVDQHNVVGTLGPQNVVDLGSSAPPGNFVIRESNGMIAEVVDNFLNIGNSRSNGIEFGFNYVSKEYGWGKLDIDFSAVYLYNLSVRTIQGALPSGAPFFRVFNETDVFSTPDFKFLLSVFYSKTLFRIDTFRTGLTLHYTGSELDVINSANGTNPIATLKPPGFVHTIGNWTTLDWQISYKFGPPEVVTPGAPNPGYDKEGKKIIGEKAVAPAPHGSSWGIRNLLADTTLTFGINNVFDTYPPLSVDNFQVNYDTNVGNPTQRFFYVEIEKQF